MTNSRGTLQRFARPLDSPIQETAHGSRGGTDLLTITEWSLGGLSGPHLPVSNASIPMSSRDPPPQVITGFRETATLLRQSNVFRHAFASKIHRSRVPTGRIQFDQMRRPRFADEKLLLVVEEELVHVSSSDVCQGAEYTTYDRCKLRFVCRNIHVKYSLIAESSQDKQNWTRKTQKKAKPTDARSDFCYRIIIL